MLGHPVERRYQLTPPSSRFYLVHFSGEFLLDTLAQADVVRTESHIPQKINALAQGASLSDLVHSLGSSLIANEVPSERLSSSKARRKTGGSGRRL